MGECSRRLRSLLHAQRRGTPAATRVARETLQALLAAESGNAEWTALLGGLTPEAVLPGSTIERAEAEWKQSQEAARRRRRDEWRRWAQDAMANRLGQLYRWIRGGGTLDAELVPVGAGAASDPAPQASPGHRSWI